MHRGTTLNFLFGLLLALSILGSMPVADAQIGLTPEQLSAIKNEPGQDEGAPFGQWGRLVDKTTFYLHRDAPTPIDGVPRGTAAVDEAFYLDYEKPKIPVVDFARDPVAGFPLLYDTSDPNDKKVLINAGAGPTPTSAGFVIPLQLSPTADLRVYGLEVDVWATCARDPTVDTSLDGTGNVVMTVGMEELTKNSAGVWGRPDYNNNGDGTAYQALSVIGSPALPALSDQFTTLQFTGSVSFGNPDLETGRLYETPSRPDGTRFQVTFALFSDANTAACVLHFDTTNYPSLVRLVSDSTRLNTWIENAAGDFATGLPSPVRTAPENRRFLSQVEHVSVWPKFNAYANPRDDAAAPRTSCTLPPTPGQDPVPSVAACSQYPPVIDGNVPVDYQDDFWDLGDDTNPDTAVTEGPGGVVQASDLRIRIRDLTSLSFVQGTGASQVQQTSRTVTNLGSGVNRIEYGWFYPDTLPDRQYRVETYSTVNGVVPSPSVGFGLKGFTFDLLDGATHTVNPGEPTEFRMRVRNVGAEEDTVSVVAAAPGNSWTASFIGGSTNRLKANGGQAEVVLLVTSPPGATAGTSQAITVTASSANFPNEVQPVDKQVTVSLVSAPTHLVDITATKTLVTLQPGVDTSLAGIRIANLGTTADTYVLQPVIPSGVTGWTFQATPLSKQISAASSGDFALRIRAPVDAAAGQAFTLGLVANRLGDSSVTDRVDIAVTVQVVHSLLVTPVQNPISMRTIEKCPPEVTAGATVGMVTGLLLCGDLRDTDNDPSILFHHVLKNTGSVTDTFTVKGDWVTSGNVNGVGIFDTTGNGSCDGSDNPDGWRFDFGPASEITNVPDRKGGGVSNSYTVAAGGHVDLYLEMGTPDPFLCDTTGNSDVSTAAIYRLAYRSTLDPSKEQVVSFGAYRTDTGAYEGTNDYAGAVRNVAIAPDAADPDAAASVQPGSKATHLVRVTNLGNEKDRLLVQVPAGTDGWTRQLRFVSSVPANAACASTSATRYVCSGVGIHDELLFQFNVTPAQSKPLGLNDRALVSVTSGDDGAIVDAKEFVTTTVGTFQFDAQAIASSLTGEKGKTVLLPFVLKNQGTSGDRLNLSLVQGDATWTPRLGLPTSNFVPGGKELSGFVSVTVPSDATAAKLFRLQATSQGNGALDVLDFTVTPVTAGALRLAGTPSNVTTIPQVGVAKAINVTVTEPAGTVGRVVKVELLSGSMPAGWKVEPAVTNVTLSGSGSPTATAQFMVTAPAGALGNSRVPFILRAVSTSGSAATGQANLLLQLADTFGVKLAAAGPMNQTVTPGGQVVYNATVANLGTSTDTIRLSTSGAPAGWLIQTDPPEFALGPLENRSVQLLVKAPANAAPRTVAATTLQAVSLGSGAVSQVAVNTQVGFFELAVNGTSGVLNVAPTETVSRVYTVHNNGTVHDEVVVTPSLLSAALSPQVTMKAEPAVVSLDPNETRQVRVDFTLGAAPPSNSDIATKVLFASRLAPTAAPANATLAGTLHVLRYVALDADGDGIGEHAVDRDGDAGNGYESYLDTGAGGGKASRLADLERFLTTEARAAKTVQVDLSNGTTVDVLRLAIDGDEDGLLDLFIDSSGDGQPDAYWDPDGAKRQDLSTVKDIDADAVPDYFVDTDLAAGLDRVYNLRTGDFTDLLSIDVDSDGTKDFVVDKNGNGALDADETVLYSKNGRLLTVQKVDMDGNGEDDSVFDTDGDGTPDYFIPAGEEDSVEIVLKDMNGDGQADWAYDADGDGRLDSYYDPASGETGLVDATSSFQQALKDYWYIPALFGVVLVLFVVLLIVTRR